MEGDVKPMPKAKGTKKKCYDIIQEIVLARDKVCQAPSCTKKVEVGHHIFTRSRNSTVFDPDNIIGLCHVHHMKFAHNKPKEFKEFLLDRMGERYYELRRESNKILQHPDYQETYEFLRKVLRGWECGK